ncbi:hypothetical protein POTOM_023189 [Populus tomentosa]|uniref:Glycosyltransferase 2-like domain-containing protein n=1 Tax=Populus tomentosa TaxID=118781 RepID=A0A8X7ZPU6_POPTO|nr:hypothetical protein POTOM_023189 [Populus tomentosa]
MERLTSTQIIPDAFQGARDDVAMQFAMIWGQIKAPLIVPLLRLAVAICLIMSLMLFIERVYMGIVIVLVKLFGRKPDRRYKWEPMKDDVEAGNSIYPMVLVQIPMYNEREVYQLSIGAACGLSWPSDRIIIQVLDDSTDPTIKDMVELECQRRASKGINIKYEVRDSRNGYKSGALKEGMKRSYVKSCDYVAIFDADFQPEPDFLRRTIPFLDHNPELGLVQTRWKFGNLALITIFSDLNLAVITVNLAGAAFQLFAAKAARVSRTKDMVLGPCNTWTLDKSKRGSESKGMFGRSWISQGLSMLVTWKWLSLLFAVNADECLMTRMQEMSLDYHFTVEQEVGSSTYAFFGFNGTAGVWRIAALNEAGGWKDRTTVEDMDLAVRASLKGWEFLYLSSVKVKNELPSTLKAYRYQQHRWSCGPANLFRKMFLEIITNKKVTSWKKVHVIYSFFLVRKIVAHLVTFIFYCVVLPATVLVPEVEVPKWGAVYIPSIITILNAVGTPRSLHLLVFWILFENVMSLHRTKATFIGLLEAGRVNEWIVTEKLGDALKSKANKAAKKPRFRFGESSGLELTSSSAVAMMLSLGRTTTSYTFMRKQSPSSSWGSAVSAPLFPAPSVFVRLGANILGHLPGRYLFKVNFPAI